MIKCRLIELEEGIKLELGDMFYKENDAGETLLIVILPNRAHFNLTTAKRLWDITGEPPKITVNPSIQYNGESKLYEPWHGFLKNGVFVDA